ncbi:NAD(P)-dependent oxidoreductase [Brachybacterium sp. EE-P12]|jgi:putative NADH-flavin reductase|uniref:NAD(P)-dependent oxidoreductase n=1 Tax=Brachybacterium sp. EE-P12 TaxID=2306299 RepID=UPI000F097298|nr:NAD(P)H-binding protein [Brachybacterium sp. EE-P12]
MRIAVFGATGMAGAAIVSESIARGHQVIAASRQPSTTASDDDRLAVRAVDVAEPEAVGPVLAEADAAVLTIRLAPGEEHRLAALTRGVLDVAGRHGTRALIVGGSAPLRSPSRPDRLLIDDPEHVPEAWKRIARASLDQYHACQEHPYTGWVYLSPPAVFEPGERSGSYLRGTTTLLTDAHGVSRITAPDFAIAVLDELENPGDDQHFTVAQHPAS